MGFKDLEDRLSKLEKRVAELDKIADERDSLWFFIEETRNQEIEAAKAIQEELEKAIMLDILPAGDA